MKLTQKQIDWVKQEKENLNRIIESRPTYGFFRYLARQEALALIIKLHNIQIEEDKRERECKTNKV